MKLKNNPDTDEQKEGVSYEKGLKFEKQFAQFMKKELGWEKVRVSAHMPGKYNAKGTSIDIFGERLSYVGIKYKKLSDKTLIGAGAMFIMCLFCYFNDLVGASKFFCILFALSAVTSIIFDVINNLNNKQNSWVECKNLKSKADITHIAKMIREFEDYKASKNTDHKFTHLYFASANGYVENALKMAEDNGIICYAKKDNSFEEVKYWDEKK